MSKVYLVTYHESGKISFCARARRLGIATKKAKACKMQTGHKHRIWSCRELKS